MLLDAASIDAPEQMGEVGGVDQPDGDRLAMGERVVRLDLERVGQRVAVVQQCSTPGLRARRSTRRRP